MYFILSDIGFIIIDILIRFNIMMKFSMLNLMVLVNLINLFRAWICFQKYSPLNSFHIFCFNFEKCRNYVVFMIVSLARFCVLIPAPDSSMVIFHLLNNNSNFSNDS